MTTSADSRRYHRLVSQPPCPQNARGLHGSLRHRPGIPTRGLLTDDDLAAMSPSMTLVVGERTEMFDSIAMRDRVRQLAPGARTELIEGAGHALIHSHVDRCVAALTAGVWDRCRQARGRRSGWP